MPTYVTYAKILAHVRGHVRRFYTNCRTLSIIVLVITTYQVLLQVKNFISQKFIFYDLVKRNIYMSYMTIYLNFVLVNKITSGT